MPSDDVTRLVCPACGNDDVSLIEERSAPRDGLGMRAWRDFTCDVCAQGWRVRARPRNGTALDRDPDGSDD